MVGEQISVIGSRFCFPHPIEFAVKRKTRSTSFLDVHGNIVFKEKETFFGSRRVLRDGAGNTLLSVKPKIFSSHMRWRAFSGDNSDSKHRLFSVRDSSLFSRSEIEVFLTTNTEEKNIDFKIKRSFTGDSCTIYKGRSDIIIAQMSKKKTSKNILKKKTRIVTIYPGVDCAFIVALVVILDQQDAASASYTETAVTASTAAA